jgi:hypothetical protein
VPLAVELLEVSIELVQTALDLELTNSNRGDRRRDALRFPWRAISSGTSRCRTVAAAC